VGGGGGPVAAPKIVGAAATREKAPSISGTNRTPPHVGSGGGRERGEGVGDAPMVGLMSQKT